ncbi:MAG TPA: hypothetical protein H9825_02615 [Candidatus Sphingobacterium stercorigallinarum]|nr:hypothetical protein [Candidatus Sphingobacterium stercorigallinarum]
MKLLKEKFSKINLVALVALFIMGGFVIQAKTADQYQSTSTYRPVYDQNGNIDEWQNVDHLNPQLDYNCSNSAEVCTAEFPEEVNPTPDMEPISQTTGTFELL